MEPRRCRMRPRDIGRLASIWAGESPVIPVTPFAPVFHPPQRIRATIYAVPNDNPLYGGQMEHSPWAVAYHDPDRTVWEPGEPDPDHPDRALDEWWTNMSRAFFTVPVAELRLAIFHPQVVHREEWDRLVKPLLARLPAPV